MATIILPKLHTLLGNFCKGIKIDHFSSEIIYGQLLQTFGDFLQVSFNLIGKNDQSGNWNPCDSFANLIAKSNPLHEGSGSFLEMRTSPTFADAITASGKTSFETATADKTDTIDVS